MNTIAAQVFVGMLVPIVLIEGAGYAIGRARIVEQTQPLSRLLRAAEAFGVLGDPDVAQNCLSIAKAIDDSSEARAGNAEWLSVSPPFAWIRPVCNRSERSMTRTTN
jgi:hypothetical protein